MATLFSLVLLLLISETAHAFKGFQPQCSLPPQITSYASSPQVRGTLSIVWSCFAVIVLCTWSVQHLHVPLESEKDRPLSPLRRTALAVFIFFAKILRKKIKTQLWNEFLDEVHWNFKRLKWMGIILLVPEFYFAKALTENAAANDSRKQFADEEWTTMHGFHANNRGFVLKFQTTAVRTSLVPTKASEEGRALYVPRPEGHPKTYYEQDPEHAEQIELQHCREICGEQCSHRVEPNGQWDKWTTSQPSLSQVDSEIAGSSDGEDYRQTLGRLQRPQTAMMIAHPQSSPGSPLPNSPVTLVDSPQLVSDPSLEASVASPKTLVNSPHMSSEQAQELETAESQPLMSSVNAPPNALTDPGHREQSSVTSVGTAVGTDNLSLSTQESPKPTLLPHKPWMGTMPLNAHQLHYAYTINLIGPPPYITSSQLKNQSKTDPLAKALTIWQILWLVIQILARSFQSPALPITLLEITVLAFAACSILIYILLWHKPQDVKVSTYIPALRPLTRADVIGLAARTPLSTLFVYEFWLHGVAVRSMSDGVFPFTRGYKIPSFRLPQILRKRDDGISRNSEKNHTTSTHDEEPTYLNPIPLGLSSGSLIFGSIHFAAWNFEFPSPLERLLWRICCGILAGLPLIMTSIYSGYMHYGKVSLRREREDGKVNVVLRRFGHVLVPVYLAARGYLLVETFRSLARSRPDVFLQVDWPSAIPHYS